MKTVLITGCSSGFGLETARLFLERGWQVLATLRTPREDALPRSERLRIIPLDVTAPASIHQMVAVAGQVDVLVNNAGIGALSPLEGTPLETVRAVFETNTFGTIAVTRAFVPQFRERRSGVIVNISSSVTMKPLPLLSAYSASKAAVNAFTESLAVELQPFQVRVRLVLPGRAPETRFAENARRQFGEGAFDAYAALAQATFATWQQETAWTRGLDVAEAVWRAATDPECPMRLPAGADALALAAAP